MTDPLAAQLRIDADEIAACGAGNEAANMRVASDRLDFQGRVRDWGNATFGPHKMADVLERQWRFIEEALEFVQSLGMTADDCRTLVAYVYGRPVGEPSQEAGGTALCFAALCEAAGINGTEAAEAELARVSTPEMMDRIRAKQAAKDAAGLYTCPLPGKPA